MDLSGDEDSPFTKFCLESLSPIHNFTSIQEFTLLRPPIEPISLNLLPKRAEKRLQSACNCKKSKCSKLYCECYSASLKCSKDCGCSNCSNQQEIDPAPPAKQSLKGCTCRKTGCRKKYCECFQNRFFCSAKCKCCSCENSQGQSFPH